MQDFLRVMSMAFVLMGVFTLIVIVRPLFRSISAAHEDAVYDFFVEDTEHRRLWSYLRQAGMALVSLLAGFLGFQKWYPAMFLIGAIPVGYVATVWLRDLSLLVEWARQGFFPPPTHPK